MISLGSPPVDKKEINAVTDLLSEGTLSTGDVVSEFEGEFSEFVGREKGAAVCSGSVALELAFEVSDLEEGDKVMVSNFNCAATLYSILRCGMEPAFADIELETYNLSPESVRERLEDVNLDGLLVTHLYGQPSELDELMEIAQEEGLVVIEDFCQSPGAKYKDKMVGTYGDFSICSFGATKNITTGEGGMVLSDDEDSIRQVRTLRSNTNGDFETPLRSVRMNDIEAAIGRQQLDKYDITLDKKNKIAELYLDSLTDEVVLPNKEPDRSHVYHGFPIRTKENVELMRYLAKRNIESSVVYDKPLHEYNLAPDADASNFPNTRLLTERVLLLPIHANLRNKEANKVISEVNSYFQ
jgi:perosamine synthetase